MDQDHVRGELDAIWGTLSEIEKQLAVANMLRIMELRRRPPADTELAVDWQDALDRLGEVVERSLPQSAKQP